MCHGFLMCSLNLTSLHLKVNQTLASYKVSLVSNWWSWLIIFLIYSPKKLFICGYFFFTVLHCHIHTVIFRHALSRFPLLDFQERCLYILLPTESDIPNDPFEIYIPYWVLHSLTWWKQDPCNVDMTKHFNQAIKLHDLMLRKLVPIQLWATTK